jgi:hypothetical protein
MDWVEFAARSEWPVVVGGSILLFYRPIKALISGLRLRKFEGWGVKAEFERGLDKVEQLAPPKEQLPLKELRRLDFRENAAPQTNYADGLLSFFYDNVSPEALVLDTWSRVEGDMRAMTDALRPQVGNVRTPPFRFEEAAHRLGLSEAEIDSLTVLRKLRNSVAHSSDRSLSWDDAARFKKSSESLLATMKKNWEELRKK